MPYGHCLIPMEDSCRGPVFTVSGVNPITENKMNIRTTAPSIPFRQPPHFRTLVVSSFAALFVLSGSVSAAGQGSLGEPGVRGGVVTTSEPLAAEAGATILRRGGNAIDAAIAVMFALNVLEPQSAGIGGGGFMMVHRATGPKKTFVIDSRETAPAASTVNMFQGQNFGLASTSGLSVGVPGAVRGAELALNNWGTMSLAQVLQPAIELAAGGFRVSSRLEESITSTRLSSELGNPAYDEARKVFRPGGVALVEGDFLVQPALAATLQLIADHGADAFYTGPLAETIVATQQNYRGANSQLAGRMSLADLSNYEAAVREPVVGDYRGYRIVGMPPPSSGGLAVIQMLKMMERFPLGDESKGYGFGSARTMNVMIESMRLAFADRAVWMGDADFVDVPVKGLLSDAYIAQRSALIDPDTRQANVMADDPWPFELAGKKSPWQLAAVNRADPPGGGTTHFSVSDANGNIVSYTNTIESAWGTGLMVPGYGFLLNNELTDFNFTPQANPDPANYDPGANDVAPLKRPRSSMAPTMIFKNSQQPLAAYGSPGGSTIINTVLNVTLNLIDHGRTIQEAIDLPRLSQTSANGTPSFEYGFPEASVQALRDIGHNPGATFDLGSVQAVVIGTGKSQYGAADKRRIGGVVSVSPDEIIKDGPGRKR